MRGGWSRRAFLGASAATVGALALEPPMFAEAPEKPFSFPGGELAATHDLVSLPLWGPYSKKYFGISHIPDVAKGLSFDLSIFPTLSGEQVVLPSVLLDQSPVHPWECAPHLEFYSYRFELLWKDQIYCDLSFSEMGEGSRLVRMEFVNRTATAREVVLNTLSQMCFPPLHEGTAEPIRLCTAELPPKTVWVNAVDYADLRFAKPRPTDTLVKDGRRRGEERRHDTVGGSVVAQDFGMDAGDEVRYELTLPDALQQAVLVLRYQLARGQRLPLALEGPGKNEITLEGDGNFRLAIVPLGTISAGRHTFRLISQGGASLTLNGFALAEAGAAAQIRFQPQTWHPSPGVREAGRGKFVLKYEDVASFYGVAFDTNWAGRREIKWRNLDQAFGSMADRRTYPRIFGSGNGHDAGDADALFLHTWSDPLLLAANAKRVVWGLVCTGAEAEVRSALASFDAASPKQQRTFALARSKAFQVATNPGGETHRKSQQLLAAVTMMNLVYPLHTQGQYIRHYSPGRCWDSLYTWDGGFVGIGLLEIDLRCTIDSLNAYTTPEGAQSAFILHGTPLPVQIYLCVELWNRTQSKELLAYFYPRLRQMHRFLAGRLGSSTTRRHKDHLLATWDYFYNSGGWDDYPPQRWVHENKKEAQITPVVNSAHAVRCAKLLRQMAEALGQDEDFAEYNRDVEEFGGSLQKYSWDEASGYFGYVTHDAQGEPTGILRTGKGVNFNMGLDGVYPIVAGICSTAQQQKMLANIFSPQHLWTDIGITTVDQSAPYYEADGYWNGSVWLAHQWFLWKTMLDLGRGADAIRIAKAGIGEWKKVTDATYKSREHFKPHQPFDDGLGWSQLSSLSSPALTWFAALYTPGRITCGFDVWIEACRSDGAHRELRATLKPAAKTTQDTYSVLVCMRAATAYRVRFNGSDIRFSLVQEGLLQVELSYSQSGELVITANA